MFLYVARTLPAMPALDLALHAVRSDVDLNNEWKACESKKLLRRQGPGRDHSLVASQIG